jgi:hypothetical protein
LSLFSPVRLIFSIESCVLGATLGNCSPFLQEETNTNRLSTKVLSPMFEYDKGLLDIKVL